MAKKKAPTIDIPDEELDTPVYLIPTLPRPTLPDGWELRSTPDASSLVYAPADGRMALQVVTCVDECGNAVPQEVTLYRLGGPGLHERPSLHSRDGSDVILLTLHVRDLPLVSDLLCFVDTIGQPDAVLSAYDESVNAEGEESEEAEPNESEDSEDSETEATNDEGDDPPGV